MGWTGVQYSVFRAALAISVASVCYSRLELVEGPAWPLLALGLPASILLAIGWRDRALAVNLLVLVGGLAAFVDGAPLVMPRLDVVYTTGLLILHLLVPITPFGSWDARERLDPRGDWRRPAWIGHVAWLCLALIHLDRALALLGPGARSTAELESVVLPGILATCQFAFVAALLLPRLRPPTWIALTMLQVAWIAAFGAEQGDAALLLFHGFAADPGWWPGRRLTPLESDVATDSRAHLFYDGDCGFCHRAVRLVLSEDVYAEESIRLRFAPLGGPTFAALLAARGEVDAEDLPDSIVVCLEDGRLLTRSAAALEVASRLGGLWRGVAVIGSVLPKSPLDAAYDLIAGVRKKLFAEPDDACPILPPELRARFDA